jgi:hypothetical protein
VETVSEDETVEENEVVDEAFDEAVEEAVEEDHSDDLSGPEDWPDEARAEVAKLRRENQRYRHQRREEKLIQTYGERAVAMVPDEVTEFSRREELAAQFAEAIGNAPTQIPPGLALVAAAPSSGGAPLPDSLSIDEFRKIVDEVGLTQASLQYGHLLDIAENPLRDRVPRPVQGSYRPPS